MNFDIYIYVYINKYYIYIICICIFTIWKVGMILNWESASSTAPNPLAVFTAETTGRPGGNSLFFIYHRCDNSKGACFLQVACAGEKP